MQAIKFTAKLLTLDKSIKINTLSAPISAIVLVLPKSASEKLPSRGMTMIKGTMNGFAFDAVVEPDSSGSHWFQVKKSILDGAKAGADDTVSMEIEPSKEWPEPKVPMDLRKMLDAKADVNTIWKDITPMARWDWIRWIGATKNPETRARRIHTMSDMLIKGKRRPCCFDRTQCTLTDA